MNNYDLVKNKVDKVYLNDVLSSAIRRVEYKLFPSLEYTLTYKYLSVEHLQLRKAKDEYGFVALFVSKEVGYICKINNITIYEKSELAAFYQAKDEFGVKVDIQVLNRIEASEDEDYVMLTNQEIDNYNNFDFSEIVKDLSYSYSDVSDFLIDLENSLSKEIIKDVRCDNPYKLVNIIYSQLYDLCSNDYDDYYDNSKLTINEAFEKVRIGSNNNPEQEVRFLDSQKAADYILEHHYPIEVKQIATAERNVKDQNKNLEYLHKLINFPFYKKAKEETDIDRIQEVLENSHYGMNQVKERILESIAVKNRTNGKNAPILCLVGSPGVGKTSIVKAIAKAMNVPFRKISMSGAKDSSVLKGHLRAYIGSNVGALANCLLLSKCNNPLILIDEIEKANESSEGNPVNVLLEALDPSQNNNFRDDYLNCGIDLSNVTFIATANYPELIPAPLKDRMEMIYLPDYAYEERLVIFKDYVFPKKKKQHNLSDTELSLTGEVIEYIVENYSIDGGIRNLERCADNICRKVCLQLQRQQSINNITINDIKEYLGNGIADIKEINDISAEIGVANAMAVNNLNMGIVHKIEAAIAPGNGELKVTGNLSDMAKESCEIAFEYIKCNMHKFAIAKEFFKENDVCVHFTKSAIVKDGNSAGIAFVTAILSAIKNLKSIDNIAMTGEISLRGNVSKIGGLKEKILGAIENGVTTIIYPSGNQNVVEQLSDDVKNNINLIPVNNYEEAYGVIFK